MNPARNRLPRRAYTLLPVAVTGERFADFAPYVASIDEDGMVAFQATLPDGGSGVYVGRADDQVDTVVETKDGVLAEITSHPDVAGGVVCFYARLTTGGSAVACVRDGMTSVVAEGHGPLGPTLNGAGVLGFRTAYAVCAGDASAVTTVAEMGSAYRAFDGLPVVDDRGCITFRADLVGGGQAIDVGDGARSTRIARTGDEYAELGRFPHSSRDGATVAFVATRPDGRSGVYVVEDGATDVVVDSSAGFESFRGALLDSAGRAVFYATPRGGALAVYAGGDSADPLLGVGTPLHGSTVAGFALNPVSVNGAGQLAIRVALADGRGMIVRADPLHL